MALSVINAVEPSASSVYVRVGYVGAVDKTSVAVVQSIEKVIVTSSINSLVVAGLNSDKVSC